MYIVATLKRFSSYWSYIVLIEYRQTEFMVSATIRQHTDYSIEQDSDYNGVKDGVKEHVDIQQVIVELLKNNNSLSAMDLAQKTGMGFRTVQRYLSQLQRKNLIKRVGGRKTGYWVVVEQTNYE